MSVAKPKGLLPEHGALIEELATKLSFKELRGLALYLPFDRRAANAVFNSVHGIEKSDFRAIVEAQTSGRGKLLEYCAAAAQFAMSRILEDVHSLTKQKLQLLEELKAQISVAKIKGCPLLEAALKRGG